MKPRYRISPALCGYHRAYEILTTPSYPATDLFPVELSPKQSFQDQLMASPGIKSMTSPSSHSHENLCDERGFPYDTTGMIGIYGPSGLTVKEFCEVARGGIISHHQTGTSYPILPNGCVGVYGPSGLTTTEYFARYDAAEKKGKNGSKL